MLILYIKPYSVVVQLLCIFLYEHYYIIIM